MDANKTNTLAHYSDAAAAALDAFDAAKHALDVAVWEMRHAGATWADVALAVSPGSEIMTRQAAQQRFGRVCEALDVVRGVRR